MTNQNTNLEFNNLLAEQYRELIRFRYNYDYIKTHIELPSCITPEVVTSLREYFLNDLYPESQERQKITESFEALKEYIHNPDKLLKISTSLMGSIFKFGFYLPLAFKAAYNSWKSYISIKELEKSVIVGAIQLNITPPFTNEHIIQCLATIPKNNLISFAKDTIHLLESFANIDLLKKTVEILKEIEKIMLKHPELYNDNDLNAIKIGLRIITNGSKLLGQFKDKERKIIIDYIQKYEMLFLDNLYK